MLHDIPTPNSQPTLLNKHYHSEITSNLWCWWSKDVHSVSWQQYKIFLKDSTEKLTLKFLPQMSIYRVLPRHQVLAEHKTRARECNLCSLFKWQLKKQDIYLSEEALQIAVKRGEAKSKEEKKDYTHLNADSKEWQGQIRTPSSGINAKK